ncbi:ATP-binding protein [Kordiimonas sp.]|uniref:ATP-binding protein n=1 Tax=Kordiimonas sp. TaxID=1970157 RepID=UPI003A95A64A
MTKSTKKIIHNRRRLGLRVKGAIGLLVILLLFVSALSYTSLRKFTDQANQLSEEALPSLAATMELTTLLEDVLQNAERLMTADVQAARRIAFNATKDSIDIGSNLANESETVAATKDLKAILAVLSTTADDMNNLIKARINASTNVHTRRERFNEWAVNGLETSTNDGTAYLLWVNSVKALVLQSASLSPGNNVRLQRRDILAINRRLTAIENDITQLPASAQPAARGIVTELKARLSGKQGVITTLRTFNQLDLRSKALSRQMRVLASELLRETNTLSVQESERAKLSTQRLIERAEKDITWLILTLLAAILIASGSIVYIDRRVLQRLTNLKDAVNAQTAGEPVIIPVEDNDEITEISEAVQYFITEIDHRQNRLLASAEQVKDVIRLSPQAMCIATPTQVLFHNKAFTALWPSHSGLVDTLNHIPPNLLEESDKTVVLDRHPVRLLDGETLWLDLASSPVDWEQQQARQLIFVDVSNQVRVEETLRSARERAEAAAQAKSSFLAMMSHEIRSPMNGIISVAEILERGTLGQEQKKLVGVINQSAETLLTIIDDILDLSKIEAGKLAINNFDFDLPAVITGVADLLRANFSQKGLSIDLELPADLPRYVHGDANRIRQILFNLLGNAAKFTESGGVTISASATLAPDTQVSIIRVMVTDTGIGIDADVLQRLFQPFEQADSSVARQYGGTGLGLSICRRLAQLMDGEIMVVSTKGEGSTFTLTLPLKPTHGQEEGEHKTTPAVPPSSASGNASAPHILVVEDNHINQIVIGKILEELSCTYDTAGDGFEALERLRDGQYDLVLTDLRMPNMDGFALARAIRQGETGDVRLPIVAVSADAMEDAREESTRSGIDAFLTKPIKLNDIRQCIENHLPVHPI